MQMVARVNVCFTAEDPAIFARRHVNAHASRAKAESLLRYNLFLDSMPTEDIQPLSTEQVCLACHIQTVSDVSCEHYELFIAAV